MATRVLIEGIGGIGGILAGAMARRGLAPVLVTGNSAIRDAIRTSGLRVTTPEEAYCVQAEAYGDLDEVPRLAGGYRAAYLVMKADRVVEAARRTMPLLDPADGHVVTYQNGIVQDLVGAAVGAERVIPGIVGWGGSMHAPGVVERTGPGSIHLGELDGRRTARLSQAAEDARAASPVVLTDNIRGAQWSKLAINCTITTLGALTGQTLGEMLGRADARHAFLRIYSEVIDTALALGVRLERIAAAPMLLYLPRDAGPVKRLAKDLLARLVGRRYRRLRSSSLQSLERGRKTEVDWLNGHVVAEARRVGQATPFNARLTELIHEIESGARPIRPSNLDDLLVAG
ncbi:MAG TPA: 2-dehydropantoate 2-reductase [Myxococcota bacterium]|nr:2-dehydropantoate 2-reductase [Myxococcota bacterium]HRY95844.1 2-dehydropantoate 2-reductase [Myxococcota bacterium]